MIAAQPTKQRKTACTAASAGMESRFAPLMLTAMELASATIRWIPATTSTTDAADLVREHGYCVVCGALSPAELSVIQPRFHTMISEAMTAADSGSLHVEVKRLIERDPCLANRMVQLVVFPIARQLIGRDITLAPGGDGDCRPAHTGAYISWHNDVVWMPDLSYPLPNAWIRCSYLIDDVDEDTGPFTLLPGSHRIDHACPSAEMTQTNGQPLTMPRPVAITSHAGDCLINNTEICQTSTPNRSSAPRMLARPHPSMLGCGSGKKATRLVRHSQRRRPIQSVNSSAMSGLGIVVGRGQPTK